MPWTTPKTDFVSGNILTAAQMNAIGENLKVLGIRLVKTQTIGAAVGSVTVTGAFSTDYDNYLVTVTNVDCAANDAGFYMRLGTSTTRADYYMVGQNVQISTGTVAYDRAAGGTAGILIGYTTQNETNLSCQVLAPFLTQPANAMCVWNSGNYGGYNSTWDQSASSYADFQIHTPTTTMTGGEIRVYGYINS